MIKKLSLKGLSDYISASPTTQRRILHEYKYPTEDESRAKILYYREAKDRITAYHESGYDRNWLINEANQLKMLGDLSVNASRKNRLRYNAMGVYRYAKYFSQRHFEILDDLTLDLFIGDVFISVFPDMHVIEKGKDKIIKLEFSKNSPSDMAIKIISQCLFEAAHRNGLPLSPSCTLYLDVPRGVEYRGARMRSRMLRDIEATCMNISAIWDSI